MFYKVDSSTSIIITGIYFINKLYIHWHARWNTDRSVQTMILETRALRDKKKVKERCPPFSLTQTYQPSIGY